MPPKPIRWRVRASILISGEPSCAAAMAHGRSAMLQERCRGLARAAERARRANTLRRRMKALHYSCAGRSQPVGDSECRSHMASLGITIPRRVLRQFRLFGGSRLWMHARPADRVIHGQLATHRICVDQAVSGIFAHPASSFAWPEP